VSPLNPLSVAPCGVAVQVGVAGPHPPQVPLSDLFRAARRGDAEGVVMARLSASLGSATATAAAAAGRLVREGCGSKLSTTSPMERWLAAGLLAGSNSPNLKCTALTQNLGQL
jgi:hypothetical protein